MLYVSGIKNGLIGVTDTNDNVTEWLDFTTFQRVYKSLANSGTETRIQGVSMVENGFIPYCKTEDALSEFISKVSTLLVKLHLMNNYDRDTAEKKIRDLARSFGFISINNSDLLIDTDKRSMIIKPLKYVYTWDEVNNFSRSKDIDMCSIDAVNLSGLGVGAFKYLYLNLDNKKVYLQDIVKEVDKINSGWWVKSKFIKYIGITPSNRMFKFMIDETVYSIQIGTKEQLYKLKDKIFNQKAESMDGFHNYVRNILNSNCDSDFVIIKATIKTGYTWHTATTIKLLKDKYKTLHDVYIKQ